MSQPMRTTFNHEEIDMMLELCRTLDEADPAAGWGSLGIDDVIANAPLLLDVLSDREKCERCPGLLKCKENPHFPRGTVASRLWIEVSGERVSVRAAYGACGLIREMKKRARDAAEHVEDDD